MLEDLLHPDDFLLAQKCMEAEPLAIRHLQETYHAPLLNYLIHAGASNEEARMLIGELWADCLADRPPRKPRLASYSGNSPLQAWLKAVALNKLLQVKRSDRRVRQISQVSLEDRVSENIAVVDGPGTTSPSEHPDSAEAPLLEIMRGAVETAFRGCDAQDFLLVQLAHTNGLKGRELARMFSCSEAKISRSLADARQRIVTATMEQVRARDPWLELKWEDFIELCGVVSPAVFGIE
jgi:DNA-directed RNA polymerase specialized sigma24 family protein